MATSAAEIKGIATILVVVGVFAIVTGVAVHFGFAAALCALGVACLWAGVAAMVNVVRQELEREAALRAGQANARASGRPEGKEPR